MSLQAQRMVWERSQATGLELLALVAIADWADLDGRNASPEIHQLAARLRLSLPALDDLLLRLEQQGELLINHRDGRMWLHLRCCYDPLYGLTASGSGSSTPAPV